MVLPTSAYNPGVSTSSFETFPYEKRHLRDIYLIITHFQLVVLQIFKMLVYGMFKILFHVMGNMFLMDKNPLRSDLGIAVT